MHTSTVFECDEHNVGVMRIPGAVVTTAGTVLAFCEARDQGGDRCPTDMVLKRSTDGGRSWGPLQLVVKAHGEDAAMNPCPVVDATTGRVFLFFNIFPAGTHESHDAPGVVRTLVTTSDDDGLTWSGPGDVTEDILDTTCEVGKATGPGCGIQTRDGRLMIPLGAGPEQTATARLIVSDDHGETWTSTPPTPSTGSETQVVELADGALRLDMRNARPEEQPVHCRYFSISRDGGRTWTEPARDDGLRDTTCQAGILRTGEGLLFSNPDGEYWQRVNMTVRLSRDDGATWPVAQTVYAGLCAYSCLVDCGDGRFGLLFENGDTRSTQRISFAAFDPAWLTADGGGLTCSS